MDHKSIGCYARADHSVRLRLPPLHGGEFLRPLTCLFALHRSRRLTIPLPWRGTPKAGGGLAGDFLQATKEPAANKDCWLRDDPDQYFKMISIAAHDSTGKNLLQKPHSENLQQ